MNFQFATKKKKKQQRTKLYERTNCLSIRFVRKKKKMTSIGTKHEENEKKVSLVGYIYFFNIFSIPNNVGIRIIDSIQISVSTIVAHPYVPCIINTMYTAVKQESYKSILRKIFKFEVERNCFFFNSLLNSNFIFFPVDVKALNSTISSMRFIYSLCLLFSHSYSSLYFLFFPILSAFLLFPLLSFSFLSFPFLSFFSIFLFLFFLFPLLFFYSTLFLPFYYNFCSFTCHRTVVCFSVN